MECKEIKDNYLSMVRLFFLISLVFCSSLTNAHSSDQFVGKVVYVVDGDTIDVMHNKSKIRVRLWGIDTPEWNQPFSKKARLFLKNEVLGKVIRVEVKDKDDYGRLVAIVKNDYKNINEELVRVGLAWVYVYYCRESVCDDWKKLEREARLGRTGLWLDNNPVPPWKWKHSHRK